MNPSVESITLIGHLAGIWRYPVKSMAGEALDEVDVAWYGLAGDRRWAFIRPDVPRSGFPWLTLRENNELWRYRPRLVNPERPDTTQTLVRTPAGRDFEVTDPALAAELGTGVRVIKQDRGIFDSMPLSLVTSGSVAGLELVTGTTLAVERFRPNLLVETDGDPFPEDGWVGSVLQIGALQLRVDRRDPRCVVINIDPQTLKRDASILRAVAQRRENCVGVYGSTVTPGRIRVGDPVFICGAARTSPARSRQHER